MPQWMLANMLLAGVLPPATINYETFVSNTGDLTTYTFAATDIGAAAADRYVILGITMDGPTHVASATVGGIAGAQAVKSGAAGNNRVAIFFVPVPTGTTATVEITVPTAAARMIVFVWAAYGLVRPVVYDTASSIADPATLDMTVKRGGVGVGVGYNEDESASTTWSGLIEDVETGNVDGTEGTAAHAAFSTSGAFAASANPSAATDWVAAAVAFANQEPAQILYVASNLSTSGSVTCPALEDGDVIVLLDTAINVIGSPPSSATPSGFTSVADTSIGSSPGIRQNISYKEADGTEGGTSISGMAAGATSAAKQLVVFRRTDGPAAVTTGGLTAEGTTGNPTLQTVAASGQGAPLLVFGCYGSTTAVTGATFSTTADDSLSAAVSSSLAWKIYNSSPANTDIDEGDGGANVLQSFFMRLT